MIAASTSWNAARNAGWAPAAQEILALGIRGIALDGAALHPDAAAAGKAIREARGSLVALFAPEAARDPAASMPGGGLCDVRVERRAPAITAATAAGRAALAAGTALVVVRAGTVPVMDGSREDEWTARLGREGRSDELAADVERAAAAIRGDRPRFLEALCRSLWELTRALPEVTWAVETPAAVAGLPFPGEFEPLLGELRGRRVAYWHDAAHAARLGAIGAVHANEWLARAGAVAAGVTVSDWSAPMLGAGGGRTPVGAGIVDWASLRDQIGASMARVLRLGPEYPPGILTESMREASARLGE